LGGERRACALLEQRDRGPAALALLLVSVTWLADDGGEVAVEGEGELFDVAPGAIGVRRGNPAVSWG